MNCKLQIANYKLQIETFTSRARFITLGTGSPILDPSSTAACLGGWGNFQFSIWGGRLGGNLEFAMAPR